LRHAGRGISSFSASGVPHSSFESEALGFGTHYGDEVYALFVALRIPFGTTFGRCLLLGMLVWNRDGKDPVVPLESPDKRNHQYLPVVGTALAVILEEKLHGTAIPDTRSEHPVDVATAGNAGDFPDGPQFRPVLVVRIAVEVLATRHDNVALTPKNGVNAMREMFHQRPLLGFHPDDNFGTEGKRRTEALAS